MTPARFAVMRRFDIVDPDVGPGRCTSRKREDGGKSWRCDQTTGHDGDHTSTSGHRSWPQLTSTHPTKEPQPCP